MTTERLAQLLLEGPEDKPTDGEEANRPKIDKKISVYLNRLLLRLFSVPAIMTYLADVVLLHDDEKPEEGCRIQLDFLRLPEEVYPQLVRLLAAPRDPKLLKYVKQGAARTGVELEVKPDDFGGEEYDYAL